MNEEKIKEVFSDEEFVKSVLKLETPEEVQKALSEKGIDLSMDEIKELAELIKKKANGELSDEELKSISGGGVVGIIVFIVVVASWVVLERDDHGLSW